MGAWFLACLLARESQDMASSAAAATLLAWMSSGLALGLFRPLSRPEALEARCGVQARSPGERLPVLRDQLADPAVAAGDVAT